MAWSIPTYNGTRMTGQPSNAVTALFELIRAVHERQDALNISRTFFIKANGTTGQTITLADLADIRASGANQFAYQNLKRIRDAIVSMVDNDYFTEGTGNTPTYSKGSLEIAAGADLTGNPTRPQDADYWQGLQDALDLLIYARRRYAFIGSTPTTSQSNLEGSLSAAWVGRFDTSPGGLTGTSTLGWERAGSFVVRGRHTNIVAYPNPGLSGTLIKAYQEYDTDVFNTTTVTMDLVCDGVTETIDVSADTSGDIEISASPSLNSSFNITCTLLGDDATVPLSASGGAANVRVFTYFTRLYFDIASELTDQA